MLKLMAEILDLDESEISEETLLEDLDEWDSLAKLSLMAEAKKNYGKIITSDVLNSFVKIRDIAKFLND